MTSVLRFGLDFDNTIICYDQVFHAVALEMKLIPPEISPSKSAVRDFLRKSGREDAWTELQGIVYGPEINRASLFPGVAAFFQFCRESGLPVFIISHKTKHPYLGKKYDLHQCALGWLTQKGFFEKSGMGLSHDQVFFELSKEEKMRRIAQVGCTHFVDDLPEFLSDKGFPQGVERILYAPQPGSELLGGMTKIASWEELTAFVALLSEKRV